MVRWLCHHKNVFTIVLIIISISNDSSAYSDNLNVPCPFLDSINITDGILNTDDDSILFEGISYPKTYYGDYDYEFVFNSYRQDVARHKRGCICTIDPKKPCVRMCLPRGKYLELTANNRYSAPEVKRAFNVSLSVYDGGSSSEENIFEYFNYLEGKPCASMGLIEPDKRPSDTWKLLKVIYPDTNTTFRNSSFFTILFFRTDIFRYMKKL